MITEVSRLDLFIWQFNALKELRAFGPICFQFVPYVSNQAKDLNLDIEAILSLKSFAHLPLFSDLPPPLKLKATILRPYGQEGNSLNLIFAPGWLPCLVANF